MFIANPTVVKTLLASAALLTGALLFICLRPYLTAAWRKASGLGRCLFACWAVGFALYGGQIRPTPLAETAALTRRNIGTIIFVR